MQSFTLLKTDISFKIYIKQFQKNRNILDIGDMYGKTLLKVKSHKRRQKIIIRSTFTRKVVGVTRRIQLENWNNSIRISQEKVNINIHSFSSLFDFKLLLTGNNVGLTFIKICAFGDNLEK